MELSYSQRLRRAAICSLLLHALIFLPLSARYKRGGSGEEPRARPLVVNLQPEAPKTRRQLVDVATPSERRPEEETNRISETNALAADVETAPGPDAGPHVEEEEDLDILTASREAVSPTPPAAPALPEPAAEDHAKAETIAAEGPPETLEPVEAPDLIEPPRAEKKIETPNPAEERLPRQEEAPPAPNVPFQVAQAPASGQVEMGADRVRGRQSDGVKRRGITNFSAIEDEIAPYMKEVRRRVERRWNEALMTRYDGTTPTMAMIDCAIDPQGEVVSVKIVGTPADRLYAALCWEAVRIAGPFGPFTFEVPKIYQGKNLEIRWTFSFL